MSYPTYDLTVKQLQEVNASRGKRWHPEGLESWTPLEWAGAMCGEAGEAANAAKKLKRLQDNINSINEGARALTTIEDAKQEVAKECADTILYAILLCEVIGKDVEEVLRYVFNKKSIEYGFPERI